MGNTSSTELELESKKKIRNSLNTIQNDHAELENTTMFVQYIFYQQTKLLSKFQLLETKYKLKGGTFHHKKK